MNLIEQDKYYKADIIIDINGNIYKNKIFKFERNSLKFFNSSKDEVIELENSIVIPSPVNAHTHLELTNFNKKNLNFSSFTDWAISIIKEKRKQSIGSLLNAYFYGRNLLNSYGIYVFGNILSPDLFNKIPNEDKIYNFIEIIGYDENIINLINIDYPKVSAHAFFSVHPLLLQRILNLNRPISMHFFESKDEYEYLLEGKGNIPNKLYPFVGLKPIKYSKEFFINFLKKAKNIQLVHLSNLPEFLKELVIKKKNEIYYTLCPRSNIKLGIEPPHYFFIKNNISFSLGTDSLCSNDDLNIFNEAKFIYEDLKDFFPKEKLIKTLFYSLFREGYKAISCPNVKFVSLYFNEIEKNASIIEYISLILGINY